MRHDDFIHALVEDHGTKPDANRFSLGIVAASGMAFSLLVFFAFLGIRADFANAMYDPHVVFKFIFAASLAGSLVPLVKASLRPEAKAALLLPYLSIPAFVLAGGIAFQLSTSPADFWLSGMIGRYPGSCLKSIPVLAIGPLVVLMVVLHGGATTRPVLSGAVAGGVAGGIAAFIYALHCPDDSALFVALWYSLAIGITSLAGALAGARYLRW
jgi:hypothetical protein